MNTGLNVALNEAHGRFLATLEIVRRELLVFEYSFNRLFAQEITQTWVESLENDMQLAEMLEAFVGRFSRLQDTIGDKLIPRTLLILAETPNSVLDNLNRAERLGWLNSVEEWLIARELRNRLVHEYITDSKRFSEDLISAKQYLNMFQVIYSQLLLIAEERCGVLEADLAKYLLAGSAKSQIASK